MGLSPSWEQCFGDRHGQQHGGGDGRRGGGPFGVAITPDGKHAYVTNFDFNTVSVIDTTTNPPSVTATVTVGFSSEGVAVTPDGKHVYVAVEAFSSVAVIDTASNTVVASVTDVPSPQGLAIAPDGKLVYAGNGGAPFSPSSNVSVIDTGSNTVVAAVAVGANPTGVGIMPPPPSVPFLAFNAQLQIRFGRRPNTDAFTLQSSFSLSSTAPAIDPVTQPVTLQVGTFTTTIPPGSFTKRRGGAFTFVGVIGGVSLQALIAPTGTLRYAFLAAAQGASLTGTTNPVPVKLAIGDDSGMISVRARIF